MLRIHEEIEEDNDLLLDIQKLIQTLPQVQLMVSPIPMFQTGILRMDEEIILRLDILLAQH